MTITSQMGSAVIELGEQNLAILVGVNSNNLTEDSFSFG